MATNYDAHQFNDAFKPSRLGNWEQPRSKGKQNEGSLKGTLRSRSGTTRFIVDDNGHLLSDVKKISNSFTIAPQDFQHSSARWPTVNPVIKTGGRATLGYKGIQTTYLPSSTVMIKTVELPGSSERIYTHVIN